MKKYLPSVIVPILTIWPLRIINNKFSSIHMDIETAILLAGISILISLSQIFIASENKQ